MIPPGATFILVDEDHLRHDLEHEERLRSGGAARRPVPCPERKGEYWGRPADSTAAIREVERLRRSGASFIVFAWPAFWWLDHYTELRDHLRSKYACRAENDRMVVFDLRK